MSRFFETKPVLTVNKIINLINQTNLAGSTSDGQTSSTFFYNDENTIARYFALVCRRLAVPLSSGPPINLRPHSWVRSPICHQVLLRFLTLFFVLSYDFDSFWCKIRFLFCKWAVSRSVLVAMAAGRSISRILGRNLQNHSVSCLTLGFWAFHFF